MTARRPATMINVKVMNSSPEIFGSDVG